MMKIDDESVIGHNKKSVDGLSSLISDADRHFLQSMDISLLTEFSIHKEVHVSSENFHKCSPFSTYVSNQIMVLDHHNPLVILRVCG